MSEIDRRLQRNNEEFRAGVRTAVAWLHERANTMNDPHAAAVLNVAAFHLGQANRDEPRTQ